MVPKILEQAVELAKVAEGVDLAQGPQWNADKNRFELRFLLKIEPFPNFEGLPDWAFVRVEVDRGFPYTSVRVFSAEDCIQFFPHQDAETGKLCLYEEKYAPTDARRLLIHLQWAKEWLSNAAQGLLQGPGDAYELPDFSRRNIRESLPTQWPLLTDECPETFLAWHGRIPGEGDVELIAGDPIPAALVTGFWDQQGRLIRKVKYGRLIGGEKKRRVKGRWILVPKGTFMRHRPPQVFGELDQLCKSAGIDLMRNLQMAWEKNNEDPKFAVVLFGFPIPEKVDHPLVEVHWQPLWFNGWTRDQLSKPKYGKHSRQGLWNLGINQGRFQGKEPLPWGRVENVSPSRLYARGGHPNITKCGPVCLAGCGALGSVVGELLARGGVRELKLIDKDVFEIGNGCRHTLDGTSLSENKALALARRIAAANPLSMIEGIAAEMPFVPDDPETKEARNAIRSARLIIDSLTDPVASRWLQEVTRETRPRMVKMFINGGASILTMGVSGRHGSCQKVLSGLYGDIANGSPISIAEHDGEDSTLLRPGAGCWQSTFPAVNSHMYALASTAVDVLESILAEPIRSHGRGIVIRRNQVLNAGRPALEVIWNKGYR